MIILRLKEYSILSWVKDKISKSVKFITSSLEKLGIIKKSNDIHEDDSSHLKDISKLKTFSLFSDLPKEYYALLKARKEILLTVDPDYYCNKSKYFCDLFDSGMIPTLFGLCVEDQISFYRKDYKSRNNGDWSEILYMYKGTLVISYDWDKDIWFLLDHTYNPSREYVIVRNRFRDAILLFFSEEDLVYDNIKKQGSEEDRLLIEDFVRKEREIILKILSK